MIKKIKTLYFLLATYFILFIVRVLRIFAPICKGKRTKDVLFLEAFTRDGAGYNYRVRYWKEALEAKGLKVDEAFIFEYAEEFFHYANQSNLQPFLLKAYVRRIRQILKARHYKVVVVRRNLVPYNSYGDHFLEKLLVAINPNCVLDFDDDIGAQESKEKSRFDRLLFAANNQFYDSFHFYQSFIVGSEYLSLIVQKYKPNAEVIIIPTCVNYTSFLPKKYEVTGDQTVTFGWIGGNQNLFLLKNIIPALNRVADEYSIRLLVIAGVDDYNFEAKFPIEYVRFSLETEKEYLRKMDIGLMPLLDDEVSRGKCGFKLLQYMGLAVPGIASAVTINMEIIQDGQNGWLVDPTVDWYDTLILVIKQKDRWKEIGHNAHQTVDSRYSFKANEDRYIHFIIKHLSYGN